MLSHRSTARRRWPESWGWRRRGAPGRWPLWGADGGQGVVVDTEQVTAIPNETGTTRPEPSDLAYELIGRLADLPDSDLAWMIDGVKGEIAHRWYKNQKD